MALDNQFGDNEETGTSIFRNPGYDFESRPESDAEKVAREGYPQPVQPEQVQQRQLGRARNRVDPEKYRAFVEEGRIYAGTSFSASYRAKEKLINSHFPSRSTSHLEPAQIGAMFEALYKVSVKYSRRRR